MILNAGHAGSRVERGQLGGVELVLHHKRAILDAPQALPGAESGQQALFGAGQS